ncbi:MAG: rhodanese-like domain-containing protein [Desulfobacterales bacterium]|nr:rhodanese-like domain-containing protein [Desulfobacterales bacterium]
MGKKIGTFAILMAVFAMFALPGVWAAVDSAPMVQDNCMKCHQNFGKMSNVMAGNLSGKSLKANSIQMKINNRLEMVKFTPETKISNVPDMKALMGGMALRVHYKTEGSDRIATEIVVKPKIKVPPEQLIDVKELAALIQKGPQKGAYTLVDSRPTPGYQKGHLPTAISIPFPKMKEMMGKLPQEKDRLIIFYCQGYR